MEQPPPPPAPMAPMPHQPTTFSQPLPGAPQPIQWMPRPTEIIPGCPPGLEYLTQLDQILVHQQVELFEVVTGIETNNKYAIKNSLGQQCYFAYEKTDPAMRICCGAERGFKFIVVDNAGAEIMRITREFKCCAGCCWCAYKDCGAWEIQVEAPVGNVISTVRQAGSFWYAKMDINNAEGETSLKVLQRQCCLCPGPCCTCDFNFDVLPRNGGSPIGAVTKQYSGFTKECFTNATNFAVTFPKDLDVKMKAALVGVTILLDMMFFEENDNDN